MLCGRTIHMDDPLLCPLVFIPLIVGRSKFNNKVCKDLSFYCFSWFISHVKFTKFHCTLNQSFNGLQLIHNFFSTGDLLGRWLHELGNKSWAFLLLSPMKMLTFPMANIILQLLLKLCWCSKRASVPFPFLWSRLNLLHEGTLLGRDTTLLLVWMGLTTKLKRDKPSSLQMLVGTHSSIHMLSLIL